MVEKMFSKDFGSPHYVYIDRLEKKLVQNLGAKIGRIQKMGGNMLCEIGGSDLKNLLKELKDNPEFSISSFRDIKLFWKRGNPYALIVLYSYENNFNLLIRVPLSAESYRNLYFGLVQTTAEYFPEAGFFKRHKLLEREELDFSLYSQPASGLDSFDIHGQLSQDRITRAIVDVSLANISQHGLLNSQDLLGRIAVISMFDYDAGIFPEIGLCMGIEKLLNIRVSKRAKALRMIVSELSRIASHLGSIGNMLEAVGYDILYSQVSIQREHVLKIMETVTGARLLPNFVRIGGVKKDINYEKITTIKKVLPVLLKKIRDIEANMLENILVFNRLKGRGVLTKEQAIGFGISGPNLRATGVRKDLRKEKDYLLYEGISFTTPLGGYGDCLERVAVRFKEIYQSLKIIHYCLVNIPEEEARKAKKAADRGFPSKPYFSSVECPHGMFHIYMETGSSGIEAMAVMGPSINSLMAAEKILEGSLLEDVSLIMASLDISGGEIIRNRWG
ncbi:MAG: hypothetical protein U5N58_12445 [Actinomycetota bacterium]|nr:hypothetical protein [Actinomycetota bacterium]